MKFYEVIDMTQGGLDFIPFAFIQLALALQKVQGMFQRVRCITPLFIYQFNFFFQYINLFSFTNRKKKKSVVFFFNFILYISGFFYLSKPIKNEENISVKIYKIGAC